MIILWFLLALAGMLFLVPLSGWATRGRLKDGIHAARAYGLCLFWLVGAPALLGVAIAALCLLTGIDPT